MALHAAQNRPMLQQRARAVHCFASAAPKPSLARKLQQFGAAAIVTTGLLTASPALAADGVFFSTPGSGVKVSSPVHVEMNVKGLEVRPAADGLVQGTGHFHIYVDVPKTEQQGEGEPIPFDDAHKHYGKGQTAADLELSPGKHTLTLQFANALHESYGPKYNSSITVNVQ